MYSRFQNRPEEGIRIPEHYSGCAFSSVTPSPERAKEEGERYRSRPMEARKPPTPTKAPPPALLLPPREMAEDAERNAPKAPPPPERPAARLFGDLGKAFPFSHGIGFDELLLLGLILLLAQSEKDHETLLWLALLLFCG